MAERMRPTDEQVEKGARALRDGIQQIIDRYGTEGLATELPHHGRGLARLVLEASGVGVDDDRELALGAMRVLREVQRVLNLRGPVGGYAPALNLLSDFVCEGEFEFDALRAQGRAEIAKIKTSLGEPGRAPLGVARPSDGASSNGGPAPSGELHGVDDRLRKNARKLARATEHLIGQFEYVLDGKRASEVPHAIEGARSAVDALRVALSGESTGRGTEL